MRKVLPNTKRTQKYLTKLPKVYLICCWARYGVREFPFVKLNKEGIPLVYYYYDGNGTCDKWILGPITDTTSGFIFDWSFNQKSAEKVAQLLNKENHLDLIF